MKSLLTVRGNLLLINLVVIGLILRLAISFWYVAVAQRSDALRLQANVDAERTIFQTNNVLAYERDSFDRSLNSPDIPTAQIYQQLLRAGIESDRIIDKVIVRARHQITGEEIFKHMPATRPILAERLEVLETHLSLLADYRNYSLSHSV